MSSLIIGRNVGQRGQGQGTFCWSAPSSTRTRAAPVSSTRWTLAGESSLRGASEVLATKWLDKQAARLRISADTIIAAIRMSWTLIEIEQLPPDEAHQLHDNVAKYKLGQGAVPSGGFLYTGAID